MSKLLQDEGEKHPEACGNSFYPQTPSEGASNPYPKGSPSL